MADDWGVASAAQYGVFSVAFMLGARALYNLYNNPDSPEEYEYIHWSDDLPPEQTVVVDATHPTLPTLSHHKASRNPAGLKPADTSTGVVLNALQQRAQWHRDIAGVTRRRYVTTNHFDIDSFLSVWCYLNRRAALEHEGVLRHMARIGDFREAFLSPDLITAHGADDRISFIREAYTALKLCCWINTLEKRLFTAPYEPAAGAAGGSGSDCAAKMGWFLERFGRVLADPESAWGDWQQEFSQVVSGFDLLAGADCMVETPPGLGLAVLSAPEPLHYYSLFSHTIGYDVVLTMYDDNRYEVEAKYTQFISLASRPVWPRLDMRPLAALLNRFEARCADDQGGSSGMVWVANSLTDTGPLLRLQPPGEQLTKAQRYGQPFDRPIHSSCIPPRKMQALVQSFLSFGLQGLKPEPGGWDWQSLHEVNQQIHWQDWSSCVLEQASRGDLDAAASGLATPRRRASAANHFGASGSTSQGAGGGGGTPRAAAAVAEQQVQLPAVEESGGRTSFARQPGFTSPANLSSPGLALTAPEGAPPPTLSQPSVIASPQALAALAASLPPLHRGNPWLLLYSTARDGISLATLMRKAERVAPSLLLIKDSAGGVFGAYVTEAWRFATRFYGSGESYVFQLQPQCLMWPWLQVPGLRNDFFQYASPEGLGVGGAGHWALSLDEELLRGSSGPCDTFGSPCLAGREEFEALAVELWHVH